MSDRTEAPTDKKRREARAKGDVVDVREATSALVIAAGLGWLYLAGPMLWAALAQVMRASLGNLALPPLAPLVLPVAALFAIVVAAAVAARASGGLALSPHAAAPQWQRVSPGAGTARLFSTRGLVDFAKSVAKAAALSGAAWGAAGPMLALVRSGGSPAMALSAGARVLAAVALTMVAVALLDAPLQHLLRTRRLRMTRQEVREEHREADQSPELRQQIAARRHALFDRSSRAAVREASVVLTNPTHFAVALRYRAGTDAAPIVVARARAEAAGALKELAAAGGVPVLHTPPLARALYFTGRPGQPIDEALYRAVATILAFVIGMTDARRAGLAPPDVELPPECRYRADGSREA